MGRLRGDAPRQHQEGTSTRRAGIPHYQRPPSGSQRAKVQRSVGHDTVTMISLGPAFPARAPDDERPFPHRLGILRFKPLSCWKPSLLGPQVLQSQAEHGFTGKLSIQECWLSLCTPYKGRLGVGQKTSKSGHLHGDEHPNIQTGQCHIAIDISRHFESINLLSLPKKVS